MSPGVGGGTRGRAPLHPHQQAQSLYSTEPHLLAAVNDITEKGISAVTQIYFCPQCSSIFS